MEQKVIITDSDRDINEWLSTGWTIISVTAQHVSNTGLPLDAILGKFCFVLQKQSI